MNVTVTQPQQTLIGETELGGVCLSRIAKQTHQNTIELRL
jgi:hypothetical protein